MIDYDLDHVFGRHTPEECDRARQDSIQAAGKEFARVVLENTPECADQQAAVRKIREAVMTATAAVALEGRELVPLVLTATGEHTARFRPVTRC
jgi:hypothetical protein